ncbi:MAG: antibiotic biosynthesis monooxygenase, partial [Chloroflexota bacterium]
MKRVKYIHVVAHTVRLNHNQKRDFVDAWNRAVQTRMQRQPGYITAWITSSPNDDEIVITSQWESETHYRAWYNSETKMRVMAHIGSYIRQHIGEKTYHVPMED